MGPYGPQQRQRLDDGGVNREYWVEQVSQTDALGFGDQPEQRAIPVEAPGPADLRDLEAGLVVPVEQLVGDFAGRRFVRQLQRLGAEPLHADDRDQSV